MIVGEIFEHTNGLHPCDTCGSIAGSVFEMNRFDTIKFVCEACIDKQFEEEEILRSKV